MKALKDPKVPLLKEDALTSYMASYDGRTNPLDIAALKEYLKSYRALDCSEPLNPLTPGP